jgi:hypothetical protein
LSARLIICVLFSSARMLWIASIEALAFPCVLRKSSRVFRLPIAVGISDRIGRAVPCFSSRRQ